MSTSTTQHNLKEIKMTLQIAKIQNKKSYLKFGSPVIAWQLVTFENGTKGAYLNNELMPLELAVKLHEINDTVYAMTSILHKHEEFKTLN
jgi:hypothetical protein